MRPVDKLVNETSRSSQRNRQKNILSSGINSNRHHSTGSSDRRDNTEASHLGAIHDMFHDMRISIDEPRFSWVTGLASLDTKPSYDHIVRETQHFVVMPSLGSLVPGWLLVVPKRQMDNCSFLNPQEVSDLTDLLSDIVVSLGRFGNKPFLFEHGGHNGSSISCGVDHAHLHIVPLAFDLCQHAIADASVQWSQLRDLSAIFGAAVGPEYLLVSDLNSRTFAGEPARATSQWFRRIIAKHVGKPEQWNYRTHPNFGIMRITRQVMAI